ncbi:MAG: M48 family metallopeptidase [Syntrophales bacterium]|nr:M48 family metallopeptidase [Syntrophales bacterium]
MAINSLMIFFIVVFLIDALGQLALAYLNISHLRRHGHDIPPVFQGEIDPATLEKMSDYTAVSLKFGSREHVFDAAVTLLVLLSGFLPWLNAMIMSLDFGFVISGLIFFGILAFLGALLGIPFNLYSTFVIERSFGFNTMTLSLWVTDLLKELIISTIILGILLGALLGLMAWSPSNWWLFIWIVFALFQLLMIWLYPVVIAPLFNKFEPVRDEALRDAIVELMSKVGLKTRGVYQVDAGKRSRHTNAYFTGLGKSKRIVLYDTLLASHSPDEIVAVLAHEIGHWKRRHILKQLLFTEVISLVLLYLLSRLLEWPMLYQTFGFPAVVPYVGLLLAAAVFGPLSFFFTPFSSMIQRRYEREADDFAHDLTGTARFLCEALKRLAKDNLSNLHPHPLYGWFYYSHPPLTERIARLQAMDGGDPS